MLDDFIVQYCKNDLRDLSGFDRTECISVELGHFVARAYPDHGCVNDLGTVHGGFLLALADMAAAGAADSYGKANATRMSLQAFCRFFGLPEEFHIEPPAPSEPLIRATSRAEALLRIYNPLDDSRRLKASPESFESLRGNYAYRREPSAYRILPIS